VTKNEALFFYLIKDMSCSH